MSILSFPRINFKGAFTTNPCTANNDDVMPAIVNRDSDTFGADITSQMTDDEIRTYLREQVMMGYPDANPQKCFPFIRSGWNLYGDYTTTFDNASVTSIVTGPGKALTSHIQDPLVGQPVVLNGSKSSDPMRRGAAMLCDLDPTGLATTQLWIGGFQFGVTAYGGSNLNVATVTFDHDTRAFQNWLNFFSTFGSYGGEQNFVGIGCMMQFAIPATAIPADIALQSPALTTFLTAARAAAGIVIRFRIWEVEPQIIDANLYAQLSKNQAPQNPAVGYLVGTIGIWEQGEPETETAGRKLTCPYPRPAMHFQPPGAPVQNWPPQLTPWTLTDANGNRLPPALIGNAVARMQPSEPVISLDLASSFPKFGFRNPNGPQKPDSQGFDALTQKMNFGAVELAVRPSGGGSPVTIGPVDYGLTSYSTYDNFGGIVDIPYNATLTPIIKSGTLILQGSSGSISAGIPLLKEQTIRLVTDDRAVYWYPPSKDNPSNTIRLKVYDRGGPTSQPTTVYLYEYFNIIQDENQKQPPPCTDGLRPNQTVQQDVRGLLKFPATITIPAGEGYDTWYPVQVKVVQSGATLLAFQTQQDSIEYGTGNVPPVTGVPVWSYATYSSVRVYTDEDFSKLYANPPLKWADVYNYVLRFYYLIYPAMSRFIPLNLEDSIVGQATLIQERLNTPRQAGFWTTYNMPVTRTISPNKVKLVLDFIAQQRKQQGT